MASNPAFLNTICKNCEAKVKKLEDAKEIKDNWSSCGVKRRIEEGGNEDQPIAKRSKTEDSNKVFIFLFAQFSLTLLLTTLLKFSTPNQAIFFSFLLENYRAIRRSKRYLKVMLRRIFKCQRASSSRYGISR